VKEFGPPDFENETEVRDFHLAVPSMVEQNHGYVDSHVRKGNPLSFLGRKTFDPGFDFLEFVVVIGKGIGCLFSGDKKRFQAVGQVMPHHVQVEVVMVGVGGQDEVRIVEWGLPVLDKPLDTGSCQPVEGIDQNLFSASLDQKTFVPGISDGNFWYRLGLNGMSRDQRKAEQKQKQKYQELSCGEFCLL
jgi:hypothetical protein